MSAASVLLVVGGMRILSVPSALIAPSGPSEFWLYTIVGSAVALVQVAGGLLILARSASGWYVGLVAAQLHIAFLLLAGSFLPGYFPLLWSVPGLAASGATTWLLLVARSRARPSA